MLEQGAGEFAKTPQFAPGRCLLLVNSFFARSTRANNLARAAASVVLNFPAVSFPFVACFSERSLSWRAAFSASSLQSSFEARGQLLSTHCPPIECQLGAYLAVQGHGS
jgi:hypothetical protein